MENRTVALAVLEDLIHWSQPNESGPAASARGLGDDEDDDGGTTVASVSAGDSEDIFREPRQRKQNRYRAVLLLPHLCLKLGSRWVETEIVPYLLRCVEEDDAQLALVTGMALLGVTLPRRTPLEPRRPAYSKSGSSSSSPDGSNLANSPNGTHLGAFLSVEDVQSVCMLLAASSTEETRQFTAQVVLPHLFLGVALERDITLESWDLKFTPLSVLQAEMETPGISSQDDEGAEDWQSNHDNPSGAAGAMSRINTHNATASTARFVEAVRKQLLGKHQHATRMRAATARSSSSVADAALSSANGHKSNGSSSSKDHTASPAPTNEEIRKRCYALALEDECVQFLYSGSYATLTGPWCFESSGRLASLCDEENNNVRDSTEGCSTSGGARSRNAAGRFRCFRRHRRRLDNGQHVGRTHPPTCLPLSGADLDLYGAAYASDADGIDGDDFSSINVRARTLVACLVRWMDALAPSTAPPTASPPTGNADSSTPVGLHTQGTLSLYDYLCFSDRRDVLRTRWRLLLRTLQGLFESPYPGPVATAVEMVSGLLGAIEATLWEFEQHQRGLEPAATHGDSDGATPQGTNTTPTGMEAEAGAWPGINVPVAPLLTTAQLQTFVYRMTRRHVAYCIAAAVSVRTVPMPPSSSTASTKGISDSMSRLVCSALVTARGVLTDVLLRHRILTRLGLPGTEAVPTMSLQLGVGPSESRAASHSVWDVSFACVSNIAGVTTPAASNIPDDATFLIATSPEVDGDIAGKATPWLPGALNAVSTFRLHRIVCRALLRALPLCIDFRDNCVASSAAHTLSSTNPSSGRACAPDASPFSLTTVCPMLVQMLVPPSALAPLLNTLRVIIELQQQAEGNQAAAPTPLERHVDPCSRTRMAPTLWAAMTAPGSVLELDTSAAEAPPMVKESPASIDFALLEATLDAVQRITAEATAHLAGATPSYPFSTVCALLFTLVATCLRWVPRYANWKARWLIAQRLPRLASTFLLLLTRICALAEEIDSSHTLPSRAHHLCAQTWLAHMLHLLSALWTNAAPFGAAPLNDLMSDEEIEIRCIAAGCAARCFGVATEAVLRVNSSARARGENVCTRSGARREQLPLSPSLSEPLKQLLDAVAPCALLAASDSDARVRCHSVGALAGLCRSLSLMVVIDPSSLAQPEAPIATREGNDPSVWARHLHSHTDALLQLTADDDPTVKLALIAELTDLLLMRMRQPRSQGCDHENRSTDEVQYDALLQCLRQLARHDLWRFRAQYAVLLAHLCGCLLLTGTINPRLSVLEERIGGSAHTHKVGCRVVDTRPVFSDRGKDETTTYGFVPEPAGLAQPDSACTASWAHTHRLYQLARTELLTLLVAVLFDKAKAVRDAALDAVERMCVEVAAANIRGAADTRTAAGDGAKGSDVERYSIANTLVDDILWPRICAHAPAWETYLNRSALLHIAMRLRVDKTSVFIPLLDKLARDPVLNVRLVVAKITLEVLLRSSSGAHAMMTSLFCSGAGDGEGDIGATASTPAPESSWMPELPSGTVAYSILMNRPIPQPLAGRGSQSAPVSSIAHALLPPLQFSEEERTGVILHILRQLLKDPSSDVRDEAAKALKVCF